MVEVHDKETDILYIIDPYIDLTLFFGLNPDFPRRLSFELN
jgi:hypothetical protein